MAETGAVDAALLARLNDPTLLGWCNGALVYGVAPQAILSFVLVDRLAHEDERDCFGEAYGETFLYLVKAVTPGTESGVVRAAAARIRTLLIGLETLPIDGYALIAPIDEVESLRIVEVDEQNPDRRVQHWGGHYEVRVQRTNGG